MDIHIGTSSFLDPSAHSPPLMPREENYWTLPWRGTGVPSRAKPRGETMIQSGQSPSPRPYRSEGEWSSSTTCVVKSQDTISIHSNASEIVVFPNQLSSTMSMSKSHELAFLLIACLGQFLSLAGMNQTVAPVISLAKYFHIEDYGTLSWLSASYSLGVGTFILPAGECSENPPFLVSRHSSQ